MNFNLASLQTKLIILSVVIAGAFYCGWTVKGWNVAANTQAAIKNDAKVAKTIEKEGDKIANDHAKKQIEIRYVYRDIAKRIDENENADNVCFTAESLQLWNQSIAGSDTHRSEPATESGTDDSIEASAKEVLKNANTNFETCKRNGARQDSLVDKILSLQGKICACSE